ncbi:MAG: division/cell wall cluster transcriptional repressor MraZ [Christensenellaceae bacterium]|nr:division/cell wall cluster transcriptional repressor MraZ [Christensenellaceae bacterium]
MLIGEYSHNLDPKGRVFIPAKFREELGEKFIVSRGIGQCLFVFAENAWIELAGKLKSIPITDQKAQVFLRMLFASACECEPDKQGRILLPARLREYAGFQKEVVAIGVMSRVELWAAETWDSYSAASGEDYEETLQKLAELGI